MRIVTGGKEAKAQADHTVKRQRQSRCNACQGTGRYQHMSARMLCVYESRCCRDRAMEAAAKIIGKKQWSRSGFILYDQFIEEAGDPDDRDRINYAKTLYELSVSEEAVQTDKRNISGGSGT